MTTYECSISFSGQVYVECIDVLYIHANDDDNMAFDVSRQNNKFICDLVSETCNEYGYVQNVM